MPESVLPVDAKKRKGIPLCTGLLDYFPNALAAVAEVSRIGNEQHNPGQPLHWDRSKSQDEDDTVLRHWMERGTLDTDGARHSAKAAWRVLAFLQKEIEEQEGVPVSRGSKAAPRPELLTAHEVTVEISKTEVLNADACSCPICEDERKLGKSVEHIVIEHTIPVPEANPA